MQFLDCSLDVVLVGAGVDNKHQGIVVFNLFHRCFRGHGEFDDVIGIHAGNNRKSQLKIVTGCLRQEVN